MLMQVVKRYKFICIEINRHRHLPTEGSRGVYWRGLLEIDPGGEQKNHALRGGRFSWERRYESNNNV